MQPHGEKRREEYLAGELMYLQSLQGGEQRTVMTRFSSLSLCVALHVYIALVVADESVLHFTLPGQVPETRTGSGQTVVADIFVKMLASPTGRRWRGFAFFASIEPVYHTWGGDLSMPPAIVGWSPHVYLKGRISGKIHNATVVDNMTGYEYNDKRETRLAIPTRFYGTLPEEEELYELHIESWDRFGLVSSSDATWEEDTTPRQYWIVLPPVRNVPNLRSDPVILVSHNVDYHSQLGFRVMAYILPHQRRDFLQNAHLQTYIASGDLEIIVWNQVSECTHFSSCQHAVQNSHATLEAWGQQRHLLFLDVDEFVALPDSVNLDNFDDQCMRSNTSATFQRFDFTCSQCSSEPGLWLGPDSKLTPHPLSHYGQVVGSHAYTAGKSMVDSNHALGFAIHGGHRLNGSATQLPHSCGRVLHIVNMFGMRKNGTGLQLSPSAWKRPFL